MIKSPLQHKMIEEPEDADILTKRNRVKRKRVPKPKKPKRIKEE